MGKISDLWVKLGLKKEGFDKGIDDVKKQTKETEGGFGKLKASAVAIWAAIGTAVVKFAKDFKDKTQAVGDAWAITAAKMQARWNVFLEALTNGFAGVTDKMKEAVRAAEEYTSAMDANFEIQNAFKLQRAAMARELTEMEIAMRDTRKTFEERLKIIEDYKDKQGRLFKKITDQAKYLEEVTIGKFIAGGDLADTQQVRDDLKNLLMYGFEDRELLAALGEALAQEETRDKTLKNFAKVGALTPQTEAAVKAEYSKDYLSQWQGGYGTNLLELWKLYNNYRNDAETMELVNALLATWEAEAEEIQSNKRVEILENNLRNQMETASQKAAETAEKEEKAIADATMEAEAELNKWLDEVLNEPIEIELEPIEFDFSANEAELEKLKERFNNQLKDMAAMAEMFNQTLTQSISGGVQTAMEAIMGLEGADATAVLGALLTPFADMAIQLGEMAIATGVGIKAIRSALENLDGIPAIAAGVALVALGSAVKAGVQALSRGSAGGAGASYGSESASSWANDVNTEMTIYVKGRLDGGDLVLSGQKTTNQWAR